MKPDTFATSILWEEHVSYDRSREIGPASEAQRKSLNMHLFCAAGLVSNCFASTTIWGVNEGLRNKTAQITENKQPQVLQSNFYWKCPE